MLDKISKGAIKGHHEISSGYMKKISVPMTDERQVAIDRFTKGHIAQHYFPDKLKDQILAEVSHIRSPHNFVSTIGLQYDKGISSSKIEGLNI
jgi:hypothetical protein